MEQSLEAVGLKPLRRGLYSEANNAFPFLTKAPIVL